MQSTRISYICRRCLWQSVTFFHSFFLFRTANRSTALERYLSGIKKKKLHEKERECNNIGSSTYHESYSHKSLKFMAKKWQKGERYNVTYFFRWHLSRVQIIVHPCKPSLSVSSHFSSFPCSSVYWEPCSYCSRISQLLRRCFYPRRNYWQTPFPTTIYLFTK